MILYKATKFLKDRFKNIPSVKTISTDTLDNIDWYSTTIYPLINIDLATATPLEAVHRVTFNIGVYQQRDTVSKADTAKFLKGNMIDNLEETYTITTQMINELRSFYNEDGIDIFSTTDIQFVKKVKNKELDGCSFQIVLELDNTIGC